MYVSINANIESFHIRFVVALWLASWLSRRGLRKQSLSNSGAWAAWFVGLASFASSFRFGLVLILFYQTSSYWTKYKQEEKARFDADHKPGGQRDATQVLSCSLLATLIAVIFLVFEGEDRTDIDFDAQPVRSFLLCAYLGHYACCAGDTWASELGVLASGEPFLITNFRRVPTGTNGGITLWGTSASLLGGVVMGAGFAICSAYQVHGMFWMRGNYQWGGCIALGACAALVGSMLDSVLGATLQATHYDTDRKCIVSTADSAATVVHSDDAPGASTGTAPSTRSGRKLSEPVAKIVEAAIAEQRSPGGSTSTRAAKKNIVHICGRDILTNTQVNFISVAVTTLLSGLLGMYFFTFVPVPPTSDENLLFNAAYNAADGGGSGDVGSDMDMPYMGDDIVNDDLFT